MFYPKRHQPARRSSKDVEMPNDHAYSSSQASLQMKRKDRKSSTEEDDQTGKRQRFQPDRSEYDIRLLDMVAATYWDEFRGEEPSHDPETRKLLINFGVTVFKRLSSSETERLVTGLATEIRAGFQSITKQLDDGLRRKQAESNKPEVVNAAMTYAAAACKAAVAPDEKQMEKAIDKAAVNGCFSVIQASNSDESTKKQAEDWTEQVSKRQKKLNIRLNRVRTTNKNNVSIYFKDSREQEKFMRSLEEDPIQGADVRSSANRKVSFALRGVPAEYTEESLERELFQYNGDTHPYFKSEALVVKDARKIKDGTRDDRKTKTFRIMATMRNARLLLEDPNLHVAMRRFKISLWKANERCHKCLENGHKGDECRGKLVCKHCSGSHLSYNCDRDSEAKKCIVCFKLRKDHKHRADVDSCPILQAEATVSTNKTIAEIMSHYGHV